MHESFPVLGGLAVGVALGALAPRGRLRLGVAVSLVLGSLATIVSGEYRIGWEFLLVDVPVVGLSTAVGLAGSRALRRRMVDGNQG